MAWQLRKQFADADVAIPVEPFAQQRIRVAIAGNAVVGRRDEALRWVKNMRQLGVRNDASPLIFASPAGYRQPPITLSADRDVAAERVTDVALDVGVDKVLGRHRPIGQ